MLVALQGAVSQGILWGIMVLGVFITFRLLDIPDMTVDGSFALGGSVVAVLVVNLGVDPVVAVLVGMLAGAVAGAVTGLLATVFEIPAILAGILTQISLWSINLRMMGKSNTPLLANETIFSRISDATGLPQSTVTMVVGAVLVVLIVLALYWFFGTEIGSALRATGNNESMIRALGQNTNATKMIALIVSNALVGLAGGLICQSQKYADIGMGTGAIVIGLAAIVIGEVLGRHPGHLPGGHLHRPHRQLQPGRHEHRRAVCHRLRHDAQGPRPRGGGGVGPETERISHLQTQERPPEPAPGAVLCGWQKADHAHPSRPATKALLGIARRNGWAWSASAYRPSYAQSSSARAAIWVREASSRAPRTVTTCSATLTSFISSSCARMTLAAVGAQVPDSTRATVRFW